MDPGSSTVALGKELSYPAYHLHHHQYLVLARIHLAERDHGLALRMLDQLLSGIERFGWRPSRREMEVHLLRALALRALGRHKEAMMAIERGLAIAEPGGYVRTFLDEGAAMRRLLQDALQHGLGGDYVAKLLEVFPTEVRTADPIEPLSDRELEVLRLVAQGLTNQQIASELILAIGTVKAHTSNIYGKLGTRNRVQAVARGRELGLL